MGWPCYKYNTFCQISIDHYRSTPSDEKLGGLLGTTTKFCFLRKLNITGQLGRSENVARISQVIKNWRRGRPGNEAKDIIQS